MATMLLTETDTLPSAPILEAATAQLAEIEQQQREGGQRLETLRGKQARLLQEQGMLREQRAALEESAILQSRSLQQAEMDAKLAASSPLGLASARERLREIRKGNKESDANREKDYQQIAERATAIAAELETLQSDSAKEQASLQELTRQEGLVRTSRDNAYTSVGQETYQAHAKRLDELQAHLDTLTAQFIDAQVALRDEKVRTYTALTDFGALREQAVMQYSLLENSMTRVFDAFEGLYNVLATEQEVLPLKVGAGYLPRELELSAREIEMILSNPLEKMRIVNLRRSAIRSLKNSYQFPH